MNGQREKQLRMLKSNKRVKLSFKVQRQRFSLLFRTFFLDLFCFSTLTTFEQSNEPIS